MLGWGKNDCGQIIIDSKEDQLLPVAIESSVDFVQLACGSGFNIGLTSEGHLYSWGDSSLGALGLGHITKQPTPKRIIKNLNDSTRFKQICAGEEHVLALTEDGDIYAWGSNDQGQLGMSNVVPLSWPHRHPNSKFSMIAVGDKHSAGISIDDQSIYLWGAGWAGQNAQPDLQKLCIPKKVIFPERIFFKSIFAGANCTFAVTNRNRIFSWGSGAHGKLGHGDMEDVLTPRPIEFFDQLFVNPIKICCRGDHVLLLTKKNEIWSWGSSAFGETGHNATTRQLSPKKIQGQKIFVDISNGKNFSVAITEDGKCYSWGSADHGLIGNGTSSGLVLIPTEIDMDVGIKSLHSSESHTIAIRRME